MILPSDRCKILCHKIHIGKSDSQLPINRIKNKIKYQKKKKNKKPNKPQNKKPYTYCVSLATSWGNLWSSFSYSTNTSSEKKNNKPKNLRDVYIGLWFLEILVFSLFKLLPLWILFKEIKLQTILATLINHLGVIQQQIPRCSSSLCDAL